MFFHGIETEQQAREIGALVHACLTAISEDLDLERLDGVTVTHFYEKSLAELDRGLDGARTLTSMDGPQANELASAPPVKRDGIIKSHLVLDAGILHHLSNPESDSCRYVIHLIAYQCAHIHGLKHIDQAFPGTVLQRHYESWADFLFDQVTWTCWGAYAASRLSARYTPNEAFDDHEEVLTQSLLKTKPAAIAFIDEGRAHGDARRLCKQVFDQFEALMKAAAVFLGDVHGAHAKVDLKAMMAGHWFTPYFERLEAALSNLAAAHGQWKDRSEFNVIADVTRDAIAECGLRLSYTDAGDLKISIS